MLDKLSDLSAALVRARRGGPELTRERFARDIRHWLEWGTGSISWRLFEPCALLDSLWDEGGITILEAVDELDSYAEERSVSTS